MNQGNVDHTSPFHPNPYPWSAFHSDDYGYLQMSILNSTHLHLEQISDNKVCSEFIENYLNLLKF